LDVGLAGLGGDEFVEGIDQFGKGEVGGAFGVGGEFTEDEVEGLFEGGGGLLDGLDPFLELGGIADFGSRAASPMERTRLAAMTMVPTGLRRSWARAW